MIRALAIAYDEVNLVLMFEKDNCNKLETEIVIIYLKFIKKGKNYYTFKLKLINLTSLGCCAQFENFFFSYFSLLLVSLSFGLKKFHF